MTTGAEVQWTYYVKSKCKTRHNGTLDKFSWIGVWCFDSVKIRVKIRVSLDVCITNAQQWIHRVGKKAATNNHGSYVKFTEGSKCKLFQQPGIAEGGKWDEPCTELRCANCSWA